LRKALRRVLSDPLTPDAGARTADARPTRPGAADPDAESDAVAA
jgi:hypothetical protein